MTELEQALELLEKAQEKIGGHEVSLLIEDAIHELEQHKDKLDGEVPF